MIPKSGNRFWEITARERRAGRISFETQPDAMEWSLAVSHRLRAGSEAVAEGISVRTMDRSQR
jgi:hypothetical protein